LLSTGNSAVFVARDIATEGAWIGAYGSQGYNIINSSISYPSFASVTPSGQSSYTWAQGSKDPRALQVPGGSNGIAACWYSSSSFSINVNLTDGQAHYVTLYALDWDSSGRSEQIQFTDGATGAVLDTETASGFSSGVYLEWAVTGNVAIMVSRLGGKNAVVSGLFFDPPHDMFSITSTSTSDTAGTPQNFTVTALGPNGNTDTTYRGTVQFTSSDAKAVLPANYTFTAADAGVHTFTATLETAGTQSIVAADTSTQLIRGRESNISVTPAAASSLTVAGLTNPDIAGMAGNFTVTAYDTYGNVATGYTGTVKFSSSDSQASLPANYTFKTGDAGKHTFSATLNTTGTESITATDTSTASITGTDSVTVVTAASTSAVLLKRDTTTEGNWIGAYGSQGYSIIGNSVSYPSYATVTSSGQSSYTWVYSTSDPRALRYANGSGRIAACWYSNNSFSINVNLTDGQTHNLALYAVDWDSLGRSEQIQITNSATGAVLDTETVSSFSSGAYLQWAVSGNVTITVSKIAGGSAVVSGLFFDPGSTRVDSLSISSPSQTDTAGTPQNFTVTAIGPNGQTDTNYTGTIAFTSTDPHAALPANYTFTAADAGTHTFSLTLETAGTQSVTVADTNKGVPSTDSNITVVPAAAASLTLAGMSNPDTAGTSSQFTVTAYDPYGNIATGYIGAVQFTSTDARAVLPASYNFEAADAGVHTFSATLKTAGTQSVTATDIANPSTTGTESNITVAAAAASSLTVTGLANPDVKGAASNFVVTVYDPYGNIATGYFGTVNFTSSDSQASLPANYTFKAADAGKHTFSATLNTTGTESITATDTTTTSITGTGSVTVTTSAGASATLVNRDTTTEGTWMGAYGSQGYNVVGDPTQYPAYATVTASGQSTYFYAYNSSDPRALQNPNGTGRIAACWYSKTSFSVNVNLTDGQTHDLALYAVDWDKSGRKEQIQITDAGTGAVLDTETISSFNTGVYLQWQVSGNVVITLKCLGGPNSVLNGLFFDTYYSTTAPNPANGSIGAPSAPFAVSLQKGQFVSSPVTVTPSDGGAGGTFTPAQVSLSSTSPTAKFTYTPPSTGTFTITTTNTASLLNPAPAKYVANLYPPTLNLNAPATGLTGSPIGFYVAATDPDPSDQFTYQWNFGDGATATTASALHTYALDALYTVTVTVTDQFAQVQTASAQVNVWRPGQVGNTTATYYTLTAPNPSATGIGIPSGSFTVALPNGRFVSSAVTVTPNDGGAGGTFTPSSLVLSNASPTATFTYTPTETGSITIGATDNGGLNNPAAVTFTAQSLVTTYSLSGPSSGTVATASSFTATLGAGWLNNPVVITPSASNADGTFSPTSFTLTNSNRSATFTYTPTLYDARNIVTTNNGNLTDPSPFAFVSDAQLGASGEANSGNQAPNLGGFDFFANGAWWQAIGSLASGYGVDPNSAALISGFGPLNVRVDFSTTTANGGNSGVGMPYSVASGNQALVPIELGKYASESDPGPVPFYAGMSIEGSQVPLPAYPPPSWLDSHALVMVRNETTGGIAYLYEGWRVGWDYVNNSWAADQLSEFNLLTGAPRPEFWTSADAAGLPISPLMVNYNEAALAAAGGPAIDHPFRIAISQGLSMNAFVWPARHAVYSGSPTSGLPMGARLQLTQAWYDANINNFDPVDQAVVTAMYQYGLIVADLTNGGGIWLEGTNDQRWNTSELNALGAIPDSAFQVLNTIQPAVNFTGPTTGTAGSPASYTITYPNTADSNFSTNLWVEVSANGGAYTYIDEFTLDDANRGPFTFNFKPPAAGTYEFQVNYSGNDWILPPPITLTVSANTHSVTLIQSGGGSNPTTWAGWAPLGTGVIATIDSNVTIAQDTTTGEWSNSIVLQASNAFVPLRRNTNRPNQRLVDGLFGDQSALSADGLY